MSGRRGFTDYAQRQTDIVNRGLSFLSSEVKNSVGVCACVRVCVCVCVRVCVRAWVCACMRLAARGTQSEFKKKTTLSFLVVFGIPLSCFGEYLGDFQSLRKQQKEPLRVF